MVNGFSTLPLFGAIFLAAASTQATVVFQGICGNKASCEQLCLTLSEETYECGCWIDHNLNDDGISCRTNSTASTAESTHSSEESHETGRIARTLPFDEPLSFNGNNFAQFPVDESTYLETNVTIEFKINEKRDSILFFGGQLAGADYLSISLIGPNVIVRHDCGEGAIEDLYRGPFALGIWHTLVVRRKNCDETEMKVDDMKLMVDMTQQFKYYKGITMDEALFVGGAPHLIAELDRKAGTTNGFNGCIQKVIVNDNILLDTKLRVNQAKDAEQLERCSLRLAAPIVTYDLTSGNPFAKAEKVLPTDERPATTQTTIVERVFEVTAPAKIVSPRILTPTSTSAPTTSTVRIAELNGQTFVTLPAPGDILDYIEFVIHFKTNSANGLLFYWNDEKKHLAVYLQNGYVNVLINMGTDAAILRSEQPISLQTWQKAEVWRSGKGILLKLNRQSWVESEVHSIGAMYTKSGNVYFGGFDGELPAELTSIPRFRGCLKKIRLNGHPVQLRMAPGVRECGSDPCAFAGCNTCVSRNDKATCLCTWPLYGHTCEQEWTHSISAMSFSGHSYLELAGDKFMDEIIGDSLKMSIEVKLKSMRNVSDDEFHQEILFYTGESDGGGDFVRLAVTQEQTVQLAMNLGAGPVLLVHPDRLEVDRWIVIEVVREKRHITLSINGQSPITTMAPLGAEELNVYKNIYIGGSPRDIMIGQGFTGCIRFAEIGDLTIDHPTQSHSAINIQNCSL